MELPKGYLSPSSLALFKANTALWIGRQLLGWKDAAGPAAWRGSAVEAGLDAVLFVQTPFCDQQAADRFEVDAQGDMSPEVQKQREIILPMLKLACEAVKGLPVPFSRQSRIELKHPGIWVPVLGYVDYVFEDFLFDLKTTERMPSAPKPDHLMQCAIYAEALKRPARLLYVTQRKHQWFDVTPEQQALGIQEAVRLAGNIKAFLALASNAHALLRATPMDFEDFRWTTDTKQLALQETAA